MNDNDSKDSRVGFTPVPIPPKTEVSFGSMTSQSLMVAMPSYKSTHPMTLFSLLALLEKRKSHRVLDFGDAYVTHTRNKCADVFLDSTCEWLFTVDDDMIVPFGNAKVFNSYTGFDLPEKFAGLDSIDRLLSHGKTLIGGLYFGRHGHGKPMYAEGCRSPEEAAFARRAPHDMIKPCRWVATGCLLVHRSVFEDIEKRFPRLSRVNNRMGGQWFSPSEHTLMDGVDRVSQMLSNGPMTGEKALKAHEMIEGLKQEAQHNSSLGTGEDVTFCIRAAAAGHQPHVDLGLVCGHIGHIVCGPKNTYPKPPK